MLAVFNCRSCSIDLVSGREFTKDLLLTVKLIVAFTLLNIRQCAASISEHFCWIQHICYFRWHSLKILHQWKAYADQCMCLVSDPILLLSMNPFECYLSPSFGNVPSSHNTHTRS